MSYYVSHLFNKGLNIRRNPSVIFKDISQPCERYISITYGYIRIVDSMNFMELSLVTLVEALELGGFVYTKEVFGDKCELFISLSS